MAMLRVFGKAVLRAGRTKCRVLAVFFPTEQPIEVAHEQTDFVQYGANLLEFRVEVAK